MSSLHLLPDGYTYQTEHSEGKLKIRIAEVRDEAAARTWLKELQTVSYITWRVSKTYPHSGRVNLFQLDMRCQHKTDSRSQPAKRPRKHTDCPASLRICVKRIVKCSRSCNAAKNSAYPTIVMVDNSHNHSIDDAAVLKFRDMSSDTKQTLLDLYKHGHTASSALHCLRTDLQLKHGDEYLRVAADGHFVPSVSKVQKLYNLEFKREYVAMSGEDMSNDDFQSTSSAADANFDRTSKPSTDSKVPLTVEEQDKLQNVFERLHAGLASNPNVFLPAVRKMLHNIDHRAATESGFVSAISNFGKHSGVPAGHHRRICANVRVQPTAIGRRKLCHAGQRRLHAGRFRRHGQVTVPPSIMVHDS